MPGDIKAIRRYAQAIVKQCDEGFVHPSYVKEKCNKMLREIGEETLPSG